jgi:hypothetical protein
MHLTKWIAVKIDGVEFEECWKIDFKYYPGEKAVMYDKNGAGHPGSGPEGSILKATLLHRRVRNALVQYEPYLLSESEFLARSGLSMEELVSDMGEAVHDAREAAYDEACDHERESAREEGRRPRVVRRMGR